MRCSDHADVSSDVHVTSDRCPPAAKEIMIADIDVEKYILQRFSEKWNSFVDVTKPNEIVDGEAVSFATRSMYNILKL